VRQDELEEADVAKPAKPAKPEELDAGKGRFLVLSADGTTLLQSHCWHIAKMQTGKSAGATCWRLSIFKGGGSVQVLP